MESNVEKLRRLVDDGAKRRWGAAIGTRSENIAFELDCIENLGRTAHLLLAKEVVDVVAETGGIVGPGRGSAPASYVCYALGITDVDPTDEGLLFEKFINSSQPNGHAFVLIDVDRRGYETFRRWLAASGRSWSCEEKRSQYAPEFYTIDGMTFGVTHVPALDLIANVYSLLEENGRERPDLGRTDVCDQDAMLVFGLGESGDIPGFSAPGLRAACFELGAFSLKELVNLYALSYPGNVLMRPEYVKRRCESGSRAEEYYAHPLLEPIYKDTLGIQTYQEQVMLVVRILGGFTRDEAIRCERAIAKRKLEEVDRFRANFVEGCLANDEFRSGKFTDAAVARNAAVRIWNELERSGRYSFMKAHCVGAARLAYRLAYLKAHYPAEWVFAKAKCREAVRSVVPVEKIPKQFDYNTIRSALERGDRVTMLIRHAERPPLDPSDTSFGEKLSITEGGYEAAKRLGARLADMTPPETIKFCASGTFRTIQTACAITDGLYGEHDLNKRYDVSIEDVLGSGSPFFGELEDRMALIRKGDYLGSLNAYYANGEQAGYRPLGVATEKMEEGLRTMTDEKHNLLVAVTHDINVAAFLAGKGVTTEFDLEKWPHYLDAVAIIDTGAERVFGYLRWDSAFDRIDI